MRPKPVCQGKFTWRKIYLAVSKLIFAYTNGWEKKNGMLKLENE
jgi:hypothetical protein